MKVFSKLRFSLCVLAVLVSLPLDAEDKYPWTKAHCERLQIAIAQDDWALAEEEMKAGADPNEYCQHYNELSAFTDAVSCQKMPWVRWLLEHGAEINKADSNETPLMRAAETGSIEIFEFLLQHGADFKARSLAKENAFIIAARCYHADLLEEIAAHHPEIVADDDSLNEALLTAAESGASQSVRALLKMGADVKTRNASEATPLIAASMFGYVVVAKILLQHGAEVNAKDNWANTALHMGARAGNLSLIKTLLAHGADPTLRERYEHRTPGEIARHEKHPEAARLIESAKRGRR